MRESENTASAETESRPPEAGTGRLVLFGHAPVPTVLEVERRPDAVRFRRAAIRLAICWLTIPVVALVPPHLPWVALALLAGPYMARREWIGEFEIRRFEGRCPGCGERLDAKVGRSVRLPMPIDCPHCHRQSMLEHAGPARAGEVPQRRQRPARTACSRPTP